MPRLYGKERKDKIRAERSSLRRELGNERKEHRRTERSLRIARAKIAEQAAQIDKMKRLIEGAIFEADRDIGPSVFKRYEQSFQTDFDNAATG